MVTIELLSALDALIWLRTGERAAALLNCTQSTVSRGSRRCLQTFDLQLEKHGGEWELLGDPTLINLERRLHQLWRWRQGSGLRVDAQHWSGHWLQDSLPAPWIRGTASYFEYQRPLDLLRDGVIDAWICSAPDYPRHPDLKAICFVSTPIQLVVKPNHPLLARGGALCFDDLADYPVLPLPDGAFPRFQRMLEQLGLWSCPQRNARLRRARWFGRQPLEDLILMFETPLRQAAGVHDASHAQPLPLHLPVVVGEVVMVRKEFGRSPHLRALLDALGERAQHLSGDLSAVRVLGSSRLLAV